MYCLLCFWLFLVWWLILGVNLTGSRVGEILILGMAVRVCPEEIERWVSELGHPRCGQASSVRDVGRAVQAGEGGRSSCSAFSFDLSISLFLSRTPFYPLSLDTRLQVLWPLNSETCSSRLLGHSKAVGFRLGLHSWPLWFWGFQTQWSHYRLPSKPCYQLFLHLADSLWWQDFAFVTVWANFP